MNSLMHTLQFTDGDLRANRQGRITNRQLHRFNQRLHIITRFALLAGILCAVLMLSILTLYGRDGGIFALGLGAMAMLSGVTLVSGSGRRVRSSPDRIQSATGFVICRPLDGKQNDSLYELIVADRRFLVDEQRLRAFEPDVLYRIYYTDSLGIVSAEPLA